MTTWQMKAQILARRVWQWAQRHPRLALASLGMLGTIAAGLAFVWYATLPGHLWGRQDGTWYRIHVNRDLYVGLEIGYPPFTEWTPEQINGIEADLARELGRRLDVQPQLLIMGFDGLYDSLHTGYVDMLISGIKPDPTLDEWVHYSAPYYDAGQVLVSLAAAPVNHIRQLEGRAIAVELASEGEIEAERWTRRLDSLEIQRYLLPDETMEAVLNGEADAALVDTISARLYTRDHPELVMAQKLTTHEPFVIAMRDGDFLLTEAIEDILAAMQADGTLERIINDNL